MPERLESRELLAVLGFDSGVVKADGRIVQLVFKGPLDSAKPGVPDWAQSQAAGSQLTLSSGATLEPLGSVVTKDATTLTWTSTFLISDPSSLVTFNTPSVQVSAPAGLLSDPSGNTTATLNQATLVNHSLVDANGFSTRSFQTGTGGLAVYVSSTFGDDSRSVAQASDPRTPFRSPAAAANALRALNLNGKGVAIRLLRGDVFDGGLDLTRLSGQDRSHPTVLEDYWYNYGTGATDPGTRPVIDVDETKGQWIGINASGPPLNDIVIRDLNFQYLDPNHSPEWSGGLFVLTGGTTWIVDDCVFNNFVYGSTVQGYGTPFAEVTFLHTIITDSHDNPGGFGAAQGSLVINTSDLLISQSTYDRNGKVDAGLVNGNIFSHDIYITPDCFSPIVWGDILTNAGATGVLMKSGGIVAYNYLGRDPIPAVLTSAGGAAVNNIVEAANNIDPANPRGWGIVLSTGNAVAQPITAAAVGNIILHVAPEAVGPGFSIATEQGGQFDFFDILIRNNTVVDGGRFLLTDGGTYSSTVRSYNNLISNASTLDLDGAIPPTYSWLKSDWNLVGESRKALASWQATTQGDLNTISFAAQFVNSSANVATYSASMSGPPTEAGFIAAARTRSLGVWEPLFDMTRLYGFYSQRYRPTNLPSPGNDPLGYYGAVPYAGATTTAAPSSLQATKLAQGSIGLNWVAPSGSGLSYTIYRGTLPDAETLYTSGVTATTFTDSAVVPGTTYYYKVTAVSAGVESPPSNEASTLVTTPTLVTIDDSVRGTGLNQFNYVGGWGSVVNSTIPNCYQGTVTNTDSANDYATVTFYGTQVNFYGALRNNRPILAISIDGGPEVRVDEYAAQDAGDVRLYTSPALAPGIHTIEIRNTGTKNVNSLGTRASIDRIEVTSGVAASIGASQATTIDDTAKGTGPNLLNYVGNWVTVVNTSIPNTYNGTVTYTDTTNDYATLTFTGSQVKFYAALRNNRGIAAISIDGGQETLVDEYAAQDAGNVLLFTGSLLTPGTHTIKVRNTGRLNPSSQGTRIDIDRVDIVTS